MGDGLIVGCGYLGRRVAALWQAAGRRVLATTRRPERAEEFRRQGWQPVVCDVLDRESLRRLPAVETAVYCVGFDRGAGRSFREVYVAGLGNVLAALPPPGRLLYVSSVGVYGQCDGGEIDESSPTEPAEESGRVVLEAERLLQERAPTAVRLRFAGIYGPDRLPRRAAVRAGEALPTDPERWLNLIHVDDGAEAVLAADARGRPGEVYNVSDDRPVRRREFYERLAELLAAPPPRFAPPPTPDGPDRRVVNRRLRQELLVTLRYPTVREGLPQAVSASS